MSRSILIVDDDPDVRESLAGALGKDGTTIRAAENCHRSVRSDARTRVIHSRGRPLSSRV